MTDFEIVRLDKESIYIGNIYTVDSNMYLPKEGRFGSEISWQSSNEKYLANDGKVTRPKYDEENVEVVLTATISKGKAVEKRQFTVTILKEERPVKIVGVVEDTLTFYKNEKVRLPSVAICKKDDGSYMTMPVTWDKTDFSKAGEYRVTGEISGADIVPAINVVVLDGERKIEKIEKKARAFPIGDVKLEDEFFKENERRNHEYLLKLNPDTLLYNFREAAGLPQKDCPLPHGWEDPSCKLRGHTTGHYLSALALSYGASGNEEFKKIIDYVVSSLRECQDAMEKSGKYSYGFLSAYSEEQFDELEKYTTYPTIWAPYYTLHKIMTGLIDCYEYAGNSEALMVVTKMADWVYNRLSKLSDAQRAKMWSIYIAGEFGGMNDCLARLYEITGKPEYLEASKYFDNDKLFYPMYKNFDTLSGMHANQHIPQMVGAMKIFEATGDPYYFNAAKNFWDIVTSGHIYSIGGVGQGEMFRDPYKVARYISDKTAETCASYNMLKLTRELFFYSLDKKYLDYYETCVYNHILASQDPNGPYGGSTYFMPLSPGAFKEFDTDGNSCCHGTGMENHSKYEDSIYFASSDNKTLYVNLYIPSSLCWGDLKIAQKGNIIKGERVEFSVQSAAADIAFRIPNWAKGYKIEFSKEAKYDEKDGFIIVPSFGDGKIILSFGMEFELKGVPDDDTISSLHYGPMVMVILSSDEKYITLSKGDVFNIRKSEKPLEFELNGYKIVPNFMTNKSRYHAYFKVK